MEYSRRDGIYQQLGSIRHAISEAHAQAAQAAQSGSSSSSSAGAAGSTSSANASAPLPSLSNYLTRIQSGVNSAIASTPLAGPSLSGVSPLAPAPSSIGYVSVPLQQPDEQIPTTGAPAITPSAATSAANAAGDVLPNYTRRTRPPAMRYMHAMSTQNGKVQIFLESVGSKQHPIYVSDICSTVAGKVRLRLSGAENITEVRLRLKGIITAILPGSGQGGSGRMMGDEQEFFFAGETLWSATDGTQALDTSRETQDFPFSLTIPENIPQTATITKSYPMPPSFLLVQNAVRGIGGVEHASVKYYVKVTVARKGLLRPNDRLFAPVIYLSRQTDFDFLNEDRRRALTYQTPLPGPLENADNWAGKKEEKVVRKGLFGNKQSTFSIAILIPVPHIYGRTEKLPFYVRISSEDRSILDKIGPSSISVMLIQRVTVKVATTAGLRQTTICRAASELDTAALLDSSEPARRFKGVLDLTEVQTGTFRAPMLDCMYYVTCGVVDQGGASTTVPITIVNIPPAAKRSSTAPAYEQGSNLSRTETAATLQLAEEVPELPPSYFDVVESSPRLGNGKN